MNTNKEYPKMIYKNVFNEEIEVNLIASRYVNNEVLYLGLVTEDGELYTDLTVNLDGIGDDNCSYVDTNNSKYAREFIEKYKLGTYMGCDSQSGFCSYPLYYFNMDEIKKYCEVYTYSDDMTVLVYDKNNNVKGTLFIGDNGNPTKEDMNTFKDILAEGCTELGIQMAIDKIKKFSNDTELEIIYIFKQFPTNWEWEFTEERKVAEREYCVTI